MLKSDDKRLKSIDWEAIELEYRMGIPSVRALASQYGCSESAIRKKAEELNWSRDLTAKVRAETEKMVRMEEVRSMVRADPEMKATEREQIEISAKIKTTIILAHRKDIPIARELVTKMFKELELQTDGIELLRELSEIMRSETAQDRRNDLYNKVIDLQGRAGTLKTLADSLKTLVALEREAFNIDAGKEDPKNNPFAELMAALVGKPMAVPIVQRDPDYDD